MTVLEPAAGSIIGHYSFDSSANADIGGLNLVPDVNAPEQVAGKLGNAYRFDATNDENLVAPNNTDYAFGDETFCVRFWMQIHDKPSGYNPIIGRYNLDSKREWGVSWSSNGTLSFGVSSNGTTRTSANYVTLAIDTWYHVVVWHDPVANVIGLRVNDSTQSLISWSNGVFDSTEPFKIGSAPGTSVEEYSNITIDDLVILNNYILSAEQITADYNGGDGLSAGDWAPAGGPLISKTSVGVSI